jgi:predicted DNA-binding transcriptional regulator YafY
LRNLLNESTGLHERIVIEDVPSSHRYLTLILDAMRDNKKLVLTYKGYSMDDYKDMTVHPYSVRLFKRRWYLIGYSEYSKGMRIYMLDRAADARMLGESFDMPEEFDAEAFFEEFHGVHPSRSEKVCVKVKFLASKRDMVRTIPLHSTQKETETTSSYSVFEYYLRPNFDFKQEILSYMTSAEVLEPAALRKELASILLDMYKLYRSDLVKA